MSRVHEKLKDLPSDSESLVNSTATIPTTSKIRKPRQSRTLFIASLLGLAVLLLIASLLRRHRDTQNSTDHNEAALGADITAKVASLAQSKRWAEIVPILEDVIKTDSQNDNALILLALAQKKNSHLDIAKSLLEKAIEISPQNFVAYNNLGLVLAAQGSWAPAIELYKKALEIHPGYPEALINSALAYEAVQMWSDAISRYQSFLKFDTQNRELHEAIKLRLRRLHTFQSYSPHQGESA